MEITELLWLGGTAATSIGVAVVVMQQITRGLEHRVESLERELALQTGRNADLSRTVGTLVTGDALDRLRGEMAAEFRGLRQDVQVQQRDLHERLTGVSRQLERLVGRLTRSAGGEDAQ